MIKFYLIVFVSLVVGLTGLEGEVLVLYPASYFQIDSIPAYLQQARDIGFTGIVVDLYEQGIANYPSDQLPSGFSFDPLEEISYHCQRLNLKFYLRLSLCKVWQSSSPPVYANHVFYSHPQWFAANNRGERMIEFTLDDLQQQNLNGYFISPLAPGLEKLAQQLIDQVNQNYPADGIIITDLTVPGIEWSYDPFLRSAFKRKYYVDPASDYLNSQLAQSWAVFYMQAPLELTYKLSLLIEDRYPLIIEAQSWEMGEIFDQQQYVDMIITDSCLVEVLAYSPKDLSDLVKLRKNTSFLIIMDLQNILTVIGYKPMLKIGLTL